MSDFSVPAFVRRQWKPGEGQPQEQGAREAEGERDWGPARADITPARRLAVTAALIGGASFVTWRFGFHWTPDRALLVFVPAALALGRLRRYVIDFVPFAVLLFLYTECRGLAHYIQPHPFYTPQLDLERFLFFGHVPSVVLQDWLWTGHRHWYDSAAFQLLKIHFVVPPVLAFALWLRRRALFYRFAATMIVLSFAGAVAFAAYPAAPPWAAGTGMGSAHGVGAHGRGLIDVQLLPPTPKLHYRAFVDPYTVSAPDTSGGSFSLASLIPKNPFAAIPSLHGGYAFLVFIFVSTLAWRRRGWARWTLIGLAALYPLAQSFAVVYTGNHYVVDLLIGFAFATGSLLAVKRAWRWLGLPE
jgi:hypothetical protein